MWPIVFWAIYGFLRFTWICAIWAAIKLLNVLGVPLTEPGSKYILTPIGILFLSPLLYILNKTEPGKIQLNQIL